MLAPTEILARQHYETLQRACSPGLPVDVAVLTGRDKGKVREATLMGLADGRDRHPGRHPRDLPGGGDLQGSRRWWWSTSSIASASRSGMMLQAKAERPPHLLVMTATPIPRTLTLANYGEMDVSRLDEMPPGRQPIETRVISEDRLDEVVEALARHLGGRRAGLLGVPAGRGEREERPRRRRGARRDAAGAVRRQGRAGPRPDEGAGEGRGDGARSPAAEIGVLVATTVIEVGVDVPNATLIVIEHADRFGLAQLHQLRGRVGRGERAIRSACCCAAAQLSETARARLALMRETNDGFRIAEEDLRLRGAGELLGTRQSGEAGFRLATPEHARRAAADRDMTMRGC